MSEDRTFIIIGASQAGGWIAKTLRTEGFEGKVILLGEEPFFPYERPPLSKGALLGDVDVDSTYFWAPESYEAEDIDVRLNTRVVGISRDAKTVTLANGEILSWDKLAITTGARVRPIEIEGSELNGVHYLRTIEDTLAIQKDIQRESNALIVGGGWIGLECAATLKKLGCNPIVVEFADRLCGRAVTPQISEWLLDFHRSRGVDIRLRTGVEKFHGKDRVLSAKLSNGDEVNCSLVVIGVGVIPNVELANQANLQVDNGICVDEMCQTSDPDIFSAGDVANHPNSYLNRRIRLESWENAMNQGISAAKSMLGKQIRYSEIPWFWSDQFDANIQMIGIPLEWDTTATRGNMEANEFVQFYLKDGLIVGAISVNSTRDLRLGKRLMQAGKQVTGKDLENVNLKLQTLLKN